MNQPVPKLPLRVPVVDGEPADSWLEALARRNQITVRKLTAALGWQVPNRPGGLVAGIPGDVLRRIEYQAGLPAGRLDDAILDRYLPGGVVLSRGSRYCPCCLAEREGRWLLAWRLPWVFACTAHRVLLRDICPVCGQVPRVYTGPAGLNPSGSCPSPIAPGKCCGADLREATQQRLALGSPLLAAQHQISALLGLAGGGPDDRALSTLSDLEIAASWVLRTAPADLFTGYGEEPLAAWHQWHEQPPATREQPRRAPPASAALTAALAAVGMSMLTGDDTHAIKRIRALLPPGAPPAQMRPAGMPAQHWKHLSEPVRGRFLRARDPDLRPADRLRYRTGTPAAAIPAAGPDRLAARARMIPQLLWPDWATRMTPAEGLLPGPLRSTLGRVPDAARRSCLRSPRRHHQPARLPRQRRHRRGAPDLDPRRPRQRARRDLLPGRVSRRLDQLHMRSGALTRQRHAEIINSKPPGVEPPLQLVQSTVQWGGRTPKEGGRDLDGRRWDQMPALAAI